MSDRNPRTPCRALTAVTLSALVLSASGIAIASARAGADGRPVPGGTRATSVSFVSPSTGFVLGTAPCGHAPCSVILRTTDRGATWSALPAPTEAVSAPNGRGLWGLRFADSESGFAYGDGLWRTSDGGARWRRVTGAAAPGKTIDDLEAVDDRELVAIAAPCTSGRCVTRPVLVHRALRGGRWSRVAGTGAGEGGDQIAVHGRIVWALLGDRLYISQDGGVSFTSEAAPCGQRRATFGPSSITDDGPHTYVLCLGEPGAGSAEKQVYVTSGAHEQWTRAGRPSSGGTAAMIAAGSDSGIVVASASGASWLYRSTDGARRWDTALTEDDGGLGWTDLGFTTPRDAVVVHGPAGLAGAGNGTGGQVLLSSDGGRTWHVTRF